MFTDIVYAMAGAPQGGDGAQPGGIGGMISGFLPLILIFVIFYFLLIRPQSKKAKDHRNMLENLKRGDKVVTSGGIYGVIESIEPNKIILKIAENVKIKVSRSAITSLRTIED